MCIRDRQELREANAHLVLAKLEADALKEAALLARARQDEFLAMLAHELRNPLAPISNAVALLARPECSPDMLPRVRGMIDRQVQHLVRLVDQLLDVSRVTQGRIVLQKAPTAVAGVVEQALETHRGLIETRHQQLRVQLPAQALMVDGDPVRLVQVVGNLLHNAAKYTPEGGAIAVTARQENDVVRIEVQDTGLGIAPEFHQRVFEKFYRIKDDNVYRIKGHGLGLYLSAYFAQLIDARITLASQPGAGACFALELMPA